MSGTHSADIQIAGARKEELPEALALLDECGLPKEGLVDHRPTTLVARIGKEIIGCSALELYHEYALLRSVAVKPSYRGRGVAASLTKSALDLANRHQVTNVYLLTETASVFFSKLGFKPIPRSKVPKEVQRSIEFTTLCPDTATVMTIALKQEPWESA
jgi:amino-acid N-acetyltransferase